jgi:UDP:flavonoid glycosyltransferase YjiC (YdhE family)
MPASHIIDSPARQKRVLIAALNWGLGHAKRCIPLIRALENSGAEVLLASDGVALHLLKAEFPHLRTISLPSYRIKYFFQNMVLNIACQMPRILYAIIAEQWHTKRIVQEYHIQGIISDNRYGCFSHSAKSIILTHQLNLRVPHKKLEWLANHILRRSLANFTEIWVPDSANEPTLSGELSHPANDTDKTRYIGLLSSFKKSAKPVKQAYDVAVVLSGPEPQRSYLAQILLDQARSMPQKFIFVLGKPKPNQHHYVADNIEVVPFLPSNELNAVIAASGVIVCRSGYSSLMDLAVMGKPAILIPTPGQTEQEYLAENLSRQQLFVVQQQGEIDLKSALEKVLQTKGLAGLHLPVNQFEPTIKNWLESL